MAQASLVQDGVDRINDAFQSIDSEFQRVQKELAQRRKTIEKQFNKSRKTVEKQTRGEVKRLRTEFRKNPIVKRAESLRKDVTKQVEDGIDNLLGLLQIASKSDLHRLDRKLNTMNRRLKEIDSARKTNGSGAPINA